jgi:hypothetical protein
MIILKNLSPKQKIVLLIQFIFIIFPCIYFIYLLIYNPNFIGKLIGPGSNQPVGWLIIIVNIFLLFLLIWLSWAIARNIKKRNYFVNMIYIFLFIILDFILFLTIILSPALLILFTTPVGKFFFNRQ